LGTDLIFILVRTGCCCSACQQGRTPSGGSHPNPGQSLYKSRGRSGGEGGHRVCWLTRLSIPAARMSSVNGGRRHTQCACGCLTRSRPFVASGRWIKSGQVGKRRRRCAACVLPEKRISPASSVRRPLTCWMRQRLLIPSWSGQQRQGQSTASAAPRCNTPWPL
jgi:hypothetical protein